ncbi:MAG: hypothetical protein OXE43_07435 [Chloroflexi bacterium]|nr:hypothetical protein [Chloroflexota bacterium]
MKALQQIAIRRMKAVTVTTLVVVSAVLAGAVLIAACDSGSDRSLEGFAVTPATVGGDVAGAVSGDEASCLEEGMGDSAYQSFRAAPLAESGRDTANVRALYDCLTEENFLIYGVGVTQVWAGGWSAETQSCSIALAREHPEFIYIQIGLEEEATAVHEADVYLLDFYDCLNTDEKIAFTLRTLSGPARMATSDLMGVLASIPESEVSCILDTVGVTREEFPQRMQADDGGEFLTEIVNAAATCISRETTVDIFVADTAKVLGGLSEQSQTCLKAFGLEHYHFLELVAGGEAAARAMPAAQAAEIADDGFRMVKCFNDDELLALQLLMARVLRQP